MIIPKAIKLKNGDWLIRLRLYQSPIKMCKSHFNCDIVIGMRHIFAMLTLSSRKCNAGTALKTD